VITTQQGLNEPRYPTLPNIMKANRKQLDVRPLAADTPRTRTLSYATLERERRRIVLEGDPRSAAEELVRRLRDEAKVL
jgi:electron transfer flavoprotein beta subunit